MADRGLPLLVSGGRGTELIPAEKRGLLNLFLFMTPLYLFFQVRCGRGGMGQWRVGTARGREPVYSGLSGLGYSAGLAGLARHGG